MLIENYRTIEDVEHIKSKTKFDCDEYKCVKNINFIYDSEDFAVKSKYKVKNNIVYPAYDGRTISLNNYIVSPIPDPSLNRRYIEKIKYDYVFNSNGRKDCESLFFYFHEGTYDDSITDLKKKVDSVSNSGIEKEIGHLDFYNEYDKNNNLISQQSAVIEGPNRNFGSQYPLLDGNFSPNEKILYTYDNLDRLIELKIDYKDYSEAFNYLTETYTYHPTLNYISKVKRYTCNIFPNSKRNLTELSYNSLGDVIEVNYNNKDGNFDKFLPKKQYYEYEYDKHNNWTKCTIFMEGTKDIAPNLVINRVIEYFNKN
jgi:hypothetical protein